MNERINPWGDDLCSDYSNLFKEFGLQHASDGLVARLPNPNRLWRR
ncbi:TPA: tryptophan--tRNA ligase, partial [Candidatus Micrarchaeota archaeon]|nr:tryptophan--tRNA ligase [Candidatus Micrarchaeota archaeon]